MKTEKFESKKVSKPKTAIVVSTGPSLTKQIPLLKKIKDHVTIISVDASFPILEKHGIKPDFATVLERVPETANFFKNNDKEFQDTSRCAKCDPWRDNSFTDAPPRLYKVF